MNVAVLPKPMTVEEFLDWCPDEEKWELVGGIPWPIMPESDLHETVKTNVVGALSRRLRPPSPCRPGVDGRQVKIDAFTSYRPNVHINCAGFSDPMAALIQAPTVVFEIAVTSLDRDLIEKRANYFRVADIEHVVIVDATERIVYHFRRDSAATSTLKPGDTLALDGKAALDMPVDEFFEWLD